MDRAKVFTQRFVQRAFRRPFDRDFRALAHFPEIEGAVYLDIGGNRGFAVDAMLMQNRTCRVHSFEPNPGLAREIEKRFANEPRVEVTNRGMGDEAGEFTLYVPVYRGYEFSGLASLIREEAETWLAGGNLLFYDAKQLQIREHRCAVGRLDDLDCDPFFIKLDVQGYEYNVLAGGRGMIARAEPILLIESIQKDDAIVRLLGEFGYRLYRYERGAFIPDETGGINSFLMTDARRRMLAT